MKSFKIVLVGDTGVGKTSVINSLLNRFSLGNSSTIGASFYRYNDTIGKEGQMITGTAPKSDGSVFRSQAEVVKAMRDSRYDRDPAYRQDIQNKLARSNINF